MAKKIAKNTYVDFEVETGETLELTLTFIALLQLKRKHSEQFAEYNRIVTKGANDELDMLTVLYTGYLCGLVMQDGDTDDAMNYEEFLSIVPPDREYIKEVMEKLLTPKKAKASADRS